MELRRDGAEKGWRWGKNWVSCWPRANYLSCQPCETLSLLLYTTVIYHRLFFSTDLQRLHCNVYSVCGNCMSKFLQWFLLWGVACVCTGYMMVISGASEPRPIRAPPTDSIHQDSATSSGRTSGSFTFSPPISCRTWKICRIRNDNLDLQCIYMYTVYIHRYKCIIKSVSVDLLRLTWVIDFSNLISTTSLAHILVSTEEKLAL
jgi:hypothetical protein